MPVAAAGSLLGVAIRPADSGWPVGKVRTMTLAPMDFLEFLDAVGEHRLLPIIEEAYRGNKPVERIFHERLLRKVREFLVVGGMPESVATARDAGTFGAMAWEAVREVQAELLRNSIADMARYAPPREPLSRKPRDSNFGKEFRHPWPSTFRAAIRSKFCGVKGFVLRAFGFPL